MCAQINSNSLAVVFYMLISSAFFFMYSLKKKQPISPSHTIEYAFPSDRLPALNTSRFDKLDIINQMNQFGRTEGGGKWNKL